MNRTRRMKTLTENAEVNFRAHSAKSKVSSMSRRTKDFIQKICYKKGASIDMTQNGFIQDSKLDPVNTYMLEPLRAQMKKIIVKPVPKPERRRCTKTKNASWKPYSPKAAPSCPPPSRTKVRKARLPSVLKSMQAKARTKKKKVRLLEPPKRKIGAVV